MLTIKVLHEFLGHHEDEKLNKIIHNQSIIMSQFSDIQTTLDTISTLVAAIAQNVANGLTAEQTAAIASSLQQIATTLQNILTPPTT